MAEKVTAIFDIGKTNKKFFLFDEKYNEVDRQYIRFDEVPDDDGFLGEDLARLEEWMMDMLAQAMQNPNYEVTHLNFSTYGASFVPVGQDGLPSAPLYNYLKPFPKEMEEKFFQIHALSREQFETNTSSPYMGLLNSGLQLFFLKYNKPHFYKKIARALHFPQYLSALFSGQFVSDHTSLGCHTGLWNFDSKCYAEWVRNEEIDQLLPPLVNTAYTIQRNIHGRPMRVGVGVHDSSSALVPYLNEIKEPFALISTGTWSICLNYFNQEPLTAEELKPDCLNFLSATGTSIKASRLFLGKHMSNVIHELSNYFKTEYNSYKEIRWPGEFAPKRKEKKKLLFNHELIRPERFGFSYTSNPDFSQFDGFIDAYMQLMDELTDIQIASLKLALGKSTVKKIYIDGGFSSSDIFLQFLANKLPGYEIYSANASYGTALGAALLVTNGSLPKNYLQKNYKIKRFE